MKATISVIIPLYNKEAIIERSLRSVLSQDYDEFEVVIVNDGSTDRSMEIVRSIQDSRIVLIEQENGGPSKARNTGVKHAKGEWIVFLDADDELRPKALSSMIEETDHYADADIIDFGGYIRKGETITPRYHPLIGKVKNPLKSFFFRQISPGCGHSIFRASFVSRYPYNERLRRYEDFEILLRMLPQAKLYSSQHITEAHNLDYVEASNARKNITEDLTGHLYLNKGSFWHRMCIFQLFLFERNNYVKECHQLYPEWYYRYDLILLNKVLNWFYKITHQ